MASNKSCVHERLLFSFVTMKELRVGESCTELKICCVVVCVYVCRHIPHEISQHAKTFWRQIKQKKMMMRRAFVKIKVYFSIHFSC